MLSRRTRFRGGTLVALDVHDLGEHERRLLRSDGYRPAACPRCTGRRLHLHDHLQRLVVDGPHVWRIGVVRYICVDRACGATWRMLPAFVARHLWRRWSTVARAIAGRTRDGEIAPAAARTLRRWRSRLRSAARQLVLLLGEHDDEDVARFARAAGFESTRLELVELLTAGRVLGPHGIEDIAAGLHQLERGIRLM